MKQVVFYYDVVCPFAFMASKFIEGLAKRTQAEIVWKPVLLGGLYKAISGEGDYSAADKMCDARKLIVGQVYYFCLLWHGFQVAKDILSHVMWIDADKYLPTNKVQIPTGELASDSHYFLTIPSGEFRPVTGEPEEKSFKPFHRYSRGYGEVHREDVIKTESETAAGNPFKSFHGYTQGCREMRREDDIETEGETVTEILFKCTQCFLKFTRHSDLQKHLTHDHVNPFKCHNFDVEMSEEDSTDGEHGEKPFRCTQCVMSFTRPSDLLVSDVTSLDVLQEGASHVGWSVDVESTINGVGKQVLLDNTQEALDRGAFGVPSFWVNNELFYGTDRMHFVESALGPDKHVTMPRLYHPPSHPTRAKLIIYHDFASPWSYLGSTQIADLVSSLHPVSVEVEWVPILVGALFKAIGTPVVPMQSVGDSKRQYFMKDLSRYSDYLSVPLKWTSHFPLRTILPARLTIANNDDRLRHALYEAAWRYDKNIGDEQVVREILTNAGYDAHALIAATKSPRVKDQLKANTERAIAAGACGVPSYQVNDGPVLWGQDRLNIVADMLCGWQDQPQQDNGPSSKL
ncbi:predicted protein [Nematostella vectensis]|uniref:C2H2-type domain-containing protein n=1 Tax=Nematostella vectensis TaxID=45351 RepID=A7S8K4_NEMVE|nr:predicted protein [Nematostella vectensis]|eukprot:XP_001632017.1 predicted protein [Nematostella vectensis]